MDRILTKRNTIVFVGLLSLWRVYLSSTLQLHPDEAYYWLWSRHLDLGYFDHSPMVAYFIRLTTIFSQSELWVRFSGILVSIIISVLLWHLALQMFSSIKTASAGVILLNTYPLTMSGSIVVTPDVPSFLFCSIALFFFWQIVRTKKYFYWYLFGISFGLSLLSKYTAILLAPCIFLFIIFTDERKWLKTIHPYLSFIAGLVLFIPVIYWNSRHNWISFNFQFGHGLGGQSFSIGRVMEYIGGQLLVAGPFIWIAGMFAGIVYIFQKNKEKLFLSLVSIPIILFFAFSSMKKLAGPNWPAFAYFTFSIIAAKYLLEGGKTKKYIFYIAFIVNFLMSLVSTLHAKFSIIPIDRISREWAIADATNWFYGWKELCAELMRYPDIEFAITPSHQLSAEIAYYTKEQLYVHIDSKVTRQSQFNLWQCVDLRRKNGFYVYVQGDAIGPYKNYFSSIDVINSLKTFRNNFPMRTYKIICGRNFLSKAS